ncbi:unannotated protein [freshwater metagenome]|uniref:Unannotated protein n=1 Tax=freshwater metagenome TaxID=449393 RepID=A0A6J6PQG4_9ZZZZ
MSDVLYLLLTVAFFAICALLVGLLDRSPDQ